jgi:hypothetical protein
VGLRIEIWRKKSVPSPLFEQTCDVGTFCNQAFYFLFPRLRFALSTTSYHKNKVEVRQSLFGSLLLPQEDNCVQAARFTHLPRHTPREQERERRGADTRAHRFCHSLSAAAVPASPPTSTSSPPISSFLITTSRLLLRLLSPGASAVPTFALGTWFCFYIWSGWLFLLEASCVAFHSSHTPIRSLVAAWSFSSLFVKAGSEWGSRASSGWDSSECERTKRGSGWDTCDERILCRDLRSGGGAVRARDPHAARCFFAGD